MQNTPHSFVFFFETNCNNDPSGSIWKHEQQIASILPRPQQNLHPFNVPLIYRTSFIPMQWDRKHSSPDPPNCRNCSCKVVFVTNGTCWSAQGAIVEEAIGRVVAAAAHSIFAFPVVVGLALFIERGSSGLEEVARNTAHKSQWGERHFSRQVKFHSPIDDHTRAIVKERQCVRYDMSRVVRV